VNCIVLRPEVCEFEHIDSIYPMESEMLRENLIELLEKNLIYFEPENYLPKYIKGIRDIYLHSSFLKSLPYSEYTLSYLLNIIIETLKKNVRFRTLDCLKVIKILIKKRPDDVEIDNETVNKLFFLYKRYIFHNNIEVQWSVSVFIKSRCLDEYNIKWLIYNYRKSEHIVNRLLLYPHKHPLITKWAEKIYKNKELNKRKSEVIALLIDNEIPNFVEEKCNDSIIWAIYYSKATGETKKKLLKKNYSLDSLPSILEVCQRLGYASTVKFILKKLRVRNGQKQK